MEYNRFVLYEIRDVGACLKFLKYKFIKIAIYSKCTEDVRTFAAGGIMATTVARMRKETIRKARERIDVRLRPEQKTEIEKAAHIKGLTVTDFIIQNAVANARQTIREFETWTLERPDTEIFAAALTEPVALGPQLTEAAKRYKDRFLSR